MHKNRCSVLYFCICTSSLHVFIPAFVKMSLRGDDIRGYSGMLLPHSCGLQTRMMLFEYLCFHAKGVYALSFSSR